jgi:hypothetical protein
MQKAHRALFCANIPVHEIAIFYLVTFMPKLLLACAIHTPQTFLTRVIEPVLCHLTEIPYDRAAAQLLLGTALKESLRLQHRRQVGGGPALGYFQMEPGTHNDIWANYLRYNQQLADQVSALLTSSRANRLFELEMNDNYAAAMARVHYLRQPAALPQFGDIQAMANYWKQYYNTPLGAGTPSEYVEHWNTAGGIFTFRANCNQN